MLVSYAIKSRFTDASCDRLYKIFQNINQEFSLSVLNILKPNYKTHLKEQATIKK